MALPCMRLLVQNRSGRLCFLLALHGVKVPDKHCEQHHRQFGIGIALFGNRFGMPCRRVLLIDLLKKTIDTVANIELGYFHI